MGWICKRRSNWCLVFMLWWCEATWDHPDDVNIREKGFRFKYGKVVEPNLEDILSKGWGKYILKEWNPIKHEMPIGIYGHFNFKSSFQNQNSIMSILTLMVVKFLTLSWQSHIPR